MSMMQEKMYMDVDDVCAILGVSKTYAYSLMREYNKELHTHHPHPYTFFPAPYSYRFILLQILLNMLQTIDLVLYIAGWHPTENHIIVLACQIGIHSFHHPVSKRN